MIPKALYSFQGTDKLNIILRQFNAWIDQKCTSAPDFHPKSFNTIISSKPSTDFAVELHEYIGSGFQSYPGNSYFEPYYPYLSDSTGFSSQTIQNLFRFLYQEANIENASSHSGRRSFITNLSEKGVSVRVIQELARHSSMVTTQRYIDVSVDKLKNAVELVGIL